MVLVRGVARKLWPAGSITTTLIAVFCAAVIFAAAAAPRPGWASETSQEFRAFVEALWPDAQARQLSRETFDAAFAQVRFDPAVVAHTNAQPEFSKPIWQYLTAAVTPARIASAKRMAREYSSWLAKAQEAYGVDRSTILGIWGLETDFGGFVGSDNVIQALSSLAFVHFRGDYFRDELLDALVILQNGDISPREMKGSWAGAMGQTQFMPSSFLAYAVDFDGAGQRNIWTDVPDAIGSTGNYLKKHGWIVGQPWGFEVVLPRKFAVTIADQTKSSPLAAWLARGVRRVGGRAFPHEGAAVLSLPAGLKGPAFLLTHNFDVIKSYNNSTSYAFAVALLGDHAYGGGAIVGRWPVRDHQLNETQVRELQSRLQSLGYAVGEVDGRLGESVRAAVRGWQEQSGVAPDGYVTAELLRRIQK
jgi:membrane-bound lytic murein transglycosylase B